MAEVKLQAGAKLDLLNKAELKSVIDAASRDWFGQVSRGDRWPRFHAQGVVAGDATLSIGGAAFPDSGLGPAEGFLWSVTRIAFAGLSANDVMSLHLNDDGAGSLVTPHIVSGYQSFDLGELVLYPGDVLLALGAALTATGTITMTGQYRELPMPLAWRLAG